MSCYIADIEDEVDVRSFTFGKEIIQCDKHKDISIYFYTYFINEYVGIEKNQQKIEDVSKSNFNCPLFIEEGTQNQNEVKLNLSSISEENEINDEGSCLRHINTIQSIGKNDNSIVVIFKKEKDNVVEEYKMFRVKIKNSVNRYKESYFFNNEVFIKNKGNINTDDRTN